MYIEKYSAYGADAIRIKYKWFIWSKVVFLAPKPAQKISWLYVEWFMSYHGLKALFPT